MLKLRTGMTLLLLFLLMVMGSPAPVSNAQEATSCPILLDEMIAQTLAACDGISGNTACFGASPVEVDAADALAFAAAGDSLPLAEIDMITTGAADPAGEAWGIALLKASLNLPDDTAPLTAILFGDASLANLVDPNATPSPTITLQNNAGYPVNLRGGAGTNFATVGTLEEDIVVTADGRNTAGDWYRVLMPSGPAWIYRDLVAVVEGDPAGLSERAPDDITLTYTIPWQAMSLTSAADAATCGAGSAGLLLQSSGEADIQLSINGVDLSFAGATVLLQGNAEILDITVLDGSLNTSANGTTLTAETGAWVEVLLDGESQPLVHQAYSFTRLEGAPVAALPTEMVCTTGMTAVSDETMLYTGPGEDYSPLTNMDTELHYTVIGQHTDSTETDWYQLDVAGYARAWVEQDSVQTIGLCNSLAAVEAPPVNAAASAPASGFVPAGQSIWQTDPGQDTTSGTCNNPPLALCAHLAALTLNTDGTLSWRGQDLTPYTLAPAGENTFAYNGRSIHNDGNVQMTLTFVDPSTWVMTMNTVYDNDPACTHTLNYTAVRNW
jgi:uncharacterized protein YraI